MSSKLQLDVCCLSCCGGAIWWMLTKERQAWCYLQVKLCDPCLSALCVPWCKKALYKYSSFPFSFRWGTDLLWMGNFEGEGAARCKVVQGVSAVSCSKTAAPIQMPLGCGSGEPIEACIRWGCTAHWRHHNNWGSRHPVAAYYSFIDPERMKGWVGWLVDL